MVEIGYYGDLFAFSKGLHRMPRPSFVDKLQTLCLPHIAVNLGRVTCWELYTVDEDDPTNMLSPFEALRKETILKRQFIISF